MHNFRLIEQNFLYSFSFIGCLPPAHTVAIIMYVIAVRNKVTRRWRTRMKCSNVYTAAAVTKLCYNVSAEYRIKGRGKSVVSEAVVPASVVRNVLKTDVDSMCRLAETKLLIGSSIAGTVGGWNAHAANVVAATFLATGQVRNIFVWRIGRTNGRKGGGGSNERKVSFVDESQLATFVSSFQSSNEKKRLMQTSIRDFKFVFAKQIGLSEL